MNKKVYFFLLSLLPLSAQAVTPEGDVISLNAALVKNANISESQAQEQVEKFSRVIKQELIKGNTVEIKNLGRFYLQHRKLVKKNPNDPNKPTEVLRKYPRFTSSELFKNEVNLQKTL